MEFAYYNVCVQGEGKSESDKPKAIQNIVIRAKVRKGSEC